MSVLLIGEAEAKFPMHTTHGRDHKAWAKRILHREDRGDKSLLPIQVKFARMAMGLEVESPEPTASRSGGRRERLLQRN